MKYVLLAYRTLENAVCHVIDFASLWMLQAIVFAAELIIGTEHNAVSFL
jgi:hypothetical protein